MKKWMSVIGASALALTGYVMVAWASPASGVSFEVLSRGTYDRFKVKSASTSSFDFEAAAKPAVDVVVRRHDYAIGSYTGWHTHPGPAFITVKTGTLTVYEYNDPTCSPRVLHQGEGYVDSGEGHMVRNESGVPAQDVTVIVAPVGGTFRGELTAPGPYCTF